MFTVTEDYWGLSEFLLERLRNLELSLQLQADYRYNASAFVDASVINGKPIVFVSIK